MHMHMQRFTAIAIGIGGNSQFYFYLEPVPPRIASKIPSGHRIDLVPAPMRDACCLCVVSKAYKAVVSPTSLIQHKRLMPAH